MDKVSLMYKIFVITATHNKSGRISWWHGSRWISARPFATEFDSIKEAELYMTQNHIRIKVPNNYTLEIQGSFHFEPTEHGWSAKLMGLNAISRKWKEFCWEKENE